MCQVDENKGHLTGLTLQRENRIDHGFSLRPPYPQTMRLKDSGVRMKAIQKSGGNQCEEGEEEGGPGTSSQQPGSTKI